MYSFYFLKYFYKYLESPQSALSKGPWSKVCDSRKRLRPHLNKKNIHVNRVHMGWRGVGRSCVGDCVGVRTLVSALVSALVCVSALTLLQCCAICWAVNNIICRT
jgi:hypothetical protein